MTRGLVIRLEPDKTTFRRVAGTLKNVGRFATIKLPNLTAKQAEWGSRRARELAPNYTGALIQAIGSQKTKKFNWQIVARTPDAKNWAGKKVPYQYFIHIGKYGALQGRVTRKRSHQFMLWTGIDVWKKYSAETIAELKKTLK